MSIECKNVIYVNWVYECKNPIKHRVLKENYVWNPSVCACEINYAYMKSLINDSAITCDEIIDMMDNLSTCKIDNYYILVFFFYW